MLFYYKTNVHLMMVKEERYGDTQSSSGEHECLNLMAIHAIVVKTFH